VVRASRAPEETHASVSSSSLPKRDQRGARTPPPGGADASTYPPPAMPHGPLACTDAERRAALALAARLRATGRSPRIEARWLRPSWPAWQALFAAAGVLGAVLSVDQPVAGLIVAGAALALSLAHRRGRLPLGRARATQDVVAPAREPGEVALIVLAAVDRPRAAVVRRVPAPLAALQVALALTAALAAVRVAGAEGIALGAAQLVPAVVLLIGVAGFLDAAVAHPAAADATATNVAIALAISAPWAEIVLVGAGDLGLRARLAAERRPPDRTVLLWLEPGPEPAWRSAHPALAAIAHDAGERLRGRALPAGARPALALYGADAAGARRIVERLEAQLRPSPPVESASPRSG
jgi:hypothetical protein